MIPLIKRFFFDETAFIRWGRAALAALGMSMQMGILPVPVLSGANAWYVGPFLVAAAFALGAGEKNRSPEEIKKIAEAKE